MSAAAIANLQRRWEKLHFSEIRRVIAREPEDVQSMAVMMADSEKPNKLHWNNHEDYYVKSQRSSDVPLADRWRIRTSWRHYFGFASDGIHFQNDGYHELDFTIDRTLDFTHWANFTGGQFRRPEVGAIICGVLADPEPAKGPHFTKWFVCDPQFKLLVDIIRHDTELTEEELASKLVTWQVNGSSNSHDMYWALLRLVLFDNVQAFVNECKGRGLYEYGKEPPEWLRHPAAGKKGGPIGFEISAWGMDIPGLTSQYVHELSFLLGEPRWWQDFLRLSEEQGVSHSHPTRETWCHACEAEVRQSGRYEYGYDGMWFEWPYKTDHRLFAGN